eukprot:CAMPEP_0117445720 /NCGR_PEP_ID=MMETSP0759-20121206/5949_1 /TAXON_ID=63605 /ORGANISM="Percolomonas cosmopolitus, Strain WS" /LENGTH=424 /DNA_ID=CAMNT_0005237921 /DNA_START=36 /DNA_END=1310 /DNA_ORIENTATION=-
MSSSLISATSNILLPSTTPILLASSLIIHPEIVNHCEDAYGGEASRVIEPLLRDMVLEADRMMDKEQNKEKESIVEESSVTATTTTTTMDGECLDQSSSPSSDLFFDTNLFEEQIDQSLCKPRQAEQFHFVKIECDSEETVQGILSDRDSYEGMPQEELEEEWNRRVVPHDTERGNDTCHSNDPHSQDHNQSRHSGLIFHVLSASEHSLWAHCIWNSGRALAKAILNGVVDVRGKRILELGSAVGLPGMAAALMGAEMVIATDYPEESILRPLRQNYETNVGKLKSRHQQRNWKVLGYRWGGKMDQLIEANDNRPFDMVFQTDLIFNHSEHRPLMESVRLAARDRTTPIETYVYFSHHRTWLIKEDMNLFEIAKEKGFQQVNLYTEKYPVMFEEDSKNDRTPEDAEIRKTVHAIRLDYTPPQEE